MNVKMLKLKSPKDFKLRKQYNAMCKTYRQKFKEYAKRVHPFDYEYALEGLMLNIAFMRDYYTLGYNVFGKEQKDDPFNKSKNVPYRVDSLSRAIDLYNYWHDFEKYHTNFCNRYKCGYVSTAEYELEYNEAKNRFFTYLSKHIEEWWD